MTAHVDNAGYHRPYRTAVVLLALAAAAALIVSTAVAVETLPSGEDAGAATISDAEVEEALLPSLRHVTGRAQLQMRCPRRIELRAGEQVDCRLRDGGRALGTARLTRGERPRDLRWELLGRRATTEAPSADGAS